MGTEKLYKALKHFFRDHQIKMGRDQLNEVLRSAHLLVTKYKRRTRTTNSRHGFRKYRNLTESLSLAKANKLWVSDITYVAIGGYFAYLSLVTDAYSHKIVGWHLAKSLEAKGPIAALKMAIEQRTNKAETLIHHSDRGIQYCCHAYTELLDENQIQISMTQNGDPYENAIAERVNGILKNEVCHTPGFPNFQMALKEITRAVRAYNKLRPHRSCDMLTPEQAHKGTGELKKWWKNYYKLNKEAQDYERSSHKPAASVSTPLPHIGPIAHAGSRDQQNFYAK